MANQNNVNYNSMWTVIQTACERSTKTYATG